MRNVRRSKIDESYGIILTIINDYRWPKQEEQLTKKSIGGSTGRYLLPTAERQFQPQTQSRDEKSTGKKSTGNPYIPCQMRPMIRSNVIVWFSGSITRDKIKKV